MPVSTDISQVSNPWSSSLYYAALSHIRELCTVMRGLTTGIRFEKCVVRRFRRSANAMECTYTNLDSMAYYRYASLNDGDTF